MFATIADPEEFSIAGLAAPRKTNATGITYAVGQEGKYLEHLKTAFPRVTRVGILADRHLFERPSVARALREAAGRLGLSLESFVAETKEELERAFADPRAGKVDAWMVPETPVVFRHEARVLALVGARKVPSIYGHPSLLAKGATMTFGVEFEGMHDELAAMLRMICDGLSARDARGCVVSSSGSRSGCDSSTMRRSIPATMTPRRMSAALSRSTERCGFSTFCALTSAIAPRAGSIRRKWHSEANAGPATSASSNGKLVALSTPPLSA